MTRAEAEAALRSRGAELDAALGLRFLETLPSGLRLTIATHTLPHSRPFPLPIDGGHHPAQFSALTTADIKRIGEVSAEIDKWWDLNGPWPVSKGLRR